MTAKRSKWWAMNQENMPDTKYTNISVPMGLRLEIERLFKDLEKKGIDLGYQSFSEFAKDAIRHRIIEIRKEHHIE